MKDPNDGLCFWCHRNLEPYKRFIDIDYSRNRTPDLPKIWFENYSEVSRLHRCPRIKPFFAL
jgi:hypothetical protein